MTKRTRDVQGFRRRYRWKLYPTAEQADQLREQAAMCAELWNALLEMCEQRKRMSGFGHVFHCQACAEATENLTRRVNSERFISHWSKAMRLDMDDTEERLTARMIGDEALALVAVAIFCAVVLAIGAIVDDARQCGAEIFASEESQ